MLSLYKYSHLAYEFSGIRFLSKIIRESGSNELHTSIKKNSGLGFFHSSDPAENNVMILLMSLRVYDKYLIQALCWDRCVFTLKRKENNRISAFVNSINLW